MRQLNPQREGDCRLTSAKCPHYWNIFTIYLAFLERPPAEWREQSPSRFRSSLRRLFAFSQDFERYRDGKSIRRNTYVTLTALRLFAILPSDAAEQ
jgi:hypothetical protein